jgi:hypothetical protein
MHRLASRVGGSIQKSSPFTEMTAFHYVEGGGMPVAAQAQGNRCALSRSEQPLLP